MGREGEVPVSFGSLHDKNLLELKKLNVAIFPVRYNEKYYSDALSSTEFTKLGSKLLKHSLDLCSQDLSVVEIYLHAQIDNEEAISFDKKFGFEIMETIQNYYTNINPLDCFVLTKILNQSPKEKGTL